MECNDFNKVKQSTLQLASADVSHIYLINDSVTLPLVVINTRMSNLYSVGRMRHNWQAR